MTENDFSNFPDPIEHPCLFDKHCSGVINWFIQRPELPWIMFKDNSGMLNGVPMCQIGDHFRKFLIKRAFDNPEIKIFLYQIGPKIVLEKVI